MHPAPPGSLLVDTALSWAQGLLLLGRGGGQGQPHTGRAVVDAGGTGSGRRSQGLRAGPTGLLSTLAPAMDPSAAYVASWCLHHARSIPTADHLQLYLLCWAARCGDRQGVLSWGLLWSARRPQQWLGISTGILGATLGSPPTPALVRPPPLFASPWGRLFHVILQLESTLWRDQGLWHRAQQHPCHPMHPPSLLEAGGTWPYPAGAPLTS